MNSVAGKLALAAALLLPLAAAEAAEVPHTSIAPQLMALPQGRVAWAHPANDAGELDGGIGLTHLTLVLNRPLERQDAFEEFLRRQQDPASPEFHHWLTADEIGERFGPAPGQVEAVASWLRSRGLTVGDVSRSGVRIEFSGTAADIGAAFGSAFHSYIVNGEKRISLAATPRMPPELAGIVQAVHGLETVFERPHHASSGPQVARASADEQPEYTNCGVTPCVHYVTPDDFAVIYHLNPLYQQGLTGAGQTVAIIGRARVNLPDIENFQVRTNLAVKDPVITVPPRGIDPGPAQDTPPDDVANINRDQSEATLDVTRVAGVAPGANINLVVSANATTVSGISVATQYVVNAVPSFAQVMTISFGGCEAAAGLAAVQLFNGLFAEAAGEGISVFVSSGDQGAAECDKSFSPPPASQSLNINDICSSSFATCVGGTQFVDSSAAQYWSTVNGAGRGSALGYIPEGAWNEPMNASGDLQIAATGGGISAFIATPSWQTVPGVPGSQGRYTPDVSFTAARHDAYFSCFAAGNGSCATESTGGFRFYTSYGTSAAAPSMAGIAALLNQKMGSPQGNLNPRLYALAGTPGVFHDVTVATSGVVNCDLQTPSLCNNSLPGLDALTTGLAGYAVGPGYDLATGLGSIDVANLFAHWATSSTQGQLQMPSPIAFPVQAVGIPSAPVVATITNIGGAPVTITSVTGTDLAEFPGSTTCSAALAPGAQCHVTVTFTPSSAGAHSATITITSNGVGSPQSFAVSGTGVAPNYQGLWWNSPAGSESGWGINLAHQGDTIFATWFTYDLTGTDNWLVMTAQKSGAGIYTGALYATAGPPFNSVPFTPSQVVASQVGVGTLAFNGASDGAFTYTIGAVTQTKQITREIFGTLPTCDTAPSIASLAAATNYTDLWWAVPGGSESGWGINLNHEGSTIFATWFTYGSNGKAMWLVITAVPSGANSYAGTVYRTSGPAFNAVPFNPANVIATPVGNATFTFSSGNAATFSYTVDGITQTKQITREIFSSTGTVCH